MGSALMSGTERQTPEGGGRRITANSFWFSGTREGAIRSKCRIETKTGKGATEKRGNFLTIKQKPLCMGFNQLNFF